MPITKPAGLHRPRQLQPSLLRRNNLKDLVIGKGGRSDLAALFSSMQAFDVKLPVFAAFDFEILDRTEQVGQPLEPIVSHIET